MKDPYKVLGIAPTATDEEIKKAYRELARKYHPDKYAESDLKDLANEKMQEINAAYEEIQKLRKNGGQSGNYGTSSGQSYSNTQTGTNGGNETYSRVRVMINNGQIDDAERTLNSIPANQHDAEWFFLMGCVLLRRGRYVDAQQYFNTACGMDPYNMEYRQARDRLVQQTGGYGGAYRTSSDGCSACDICQALICADCCCSMSRGC